MAVITDISIQAKNKERVNIYIDGAFLCGMQMFVVVSSGLKVGQHIDVEELSRIQFESEKDTAVQKVFGYASRFMKTEKQIREYMRDKGYMQEIIDYCVDKLVEYKYIDDVTYAEMYVQSKPLKGKDLLKFELRQKGVDRQIIDEIIEQVDDEQQVVAATEVAEKYLRGKEYTRETRQKLYVRLRSKGYSNDVAKAAMSRIEEGDVEGF